MSIKALPEEIRQKIRAGIAINSVSQCVEELVQNSLDAGATCVAVRLDLQFFKIQVVDNGRGISYTDLKVLGERYSTSKCFTLSDLDNTRYYGYRGEALASICEVSSDVTVVSELLNTETTHAKTMSHGLSSSQTGVNLTNRRASHGTTVTVWGFMHNMPVRQATIDAVLDIERTRKSLESLSLVHPLVSFSLHDNGADIQCMAVPKTGSVPRTFGLLFGSHWVPQLQWCTRGDGPYVVSGYLSARGHRNRNLQFLFVHRRRIVGHRLQKVLSEMIEKRAWPGGAASQGPSLAMSPRNNIRSPTKHQLPRSVSESFAVFMLDIECPRKYYEVGLHPTKTVIEFRNYDDLLTIAKELIMNFFNIPNVDNATPATVVRATTEPTGNPYQEIAVQNVKHSMHSLPVKRSYQATALVEDKSDASIKRPALDSLDPLHTPEMPETHQTESELHENIQAIPASVRKSVASQNLPTKKNPVTYRDVANQAQQFTDVRSRLVEKNDMSEDPTPNHEASSCTTRLVDRCGLPCDQLRSALSCHQHSRDRPIRLTKALRGGELTALEKLSRYKARSERIAHALNDLKKFSFVRPTPSQSASKSQEATINNFIAADKVSRPARSVASSDNVQESSNGRHNRQSVSIHTAHPICGTSVSRTKINNSIRSGPGSGRKISVSPSHQLTNATTFPKSTFTQNHGDKNNTTFSQVNRGLDDVQGIQYISDQAFLREVEIDRQHPTLITTRDVFYSTNQVTSEMSHPPVRFYNREEQELGNGFRWGLLQLPEREPCWSDGPLVQCDELTRQSPECFDRFTDLLSKPKSSNNESNDTEPFELICESQPFKVSIDDRHPSKSSPYRKERIVANSQVSISRLSASPVQPLLVTKSPLMVVAADTDCSTEHRLEAHNRDGMIGNSQDSFSVSGDCYGDGTESIIAAPCRSSFLEIVAKTPDVLLESSSRLVAEGILVSASLSEGRSDCCTITQESSSAVPIKNHAASVNRIPQGIPETSSEDIASLFEHSKDDSDTTNFITLENNRNQCATTISDSGVEPLLSSMDIDDSEECSRNPSNGERAESNEATVPEQQNTCAELSDGVAVASSESHFLASWISGADVRESPRKVFIDRRSGNSYFEDPELVVTNTSASALVEWAAPDKLAIGDGEIPLSASTLPSRPWRVRPPSPLQNKLTTLATRPQTKNPEVQNIARMLRTWNNPVFRSVHSEPSAEILCEASKILNSRYKRPYIFDRSIFDNIQVISQVDHKFIACMVHYQHPERSNGENLDPNVLVMFDQHAVHERIRLEELLADK